ILHVKNREFADLTPVIEALAPLGNSLYIGAFRNAINSGAQENYYDIDIGQAFVKRWRGWRGGPERSQRDSAVFLSDVLRNLFRYDSLEINTSADDKTLIFTIEGRTYRLEEMGSGIAQFLIVLANAAIKKPDLILIDEPELNLHPS